MVQGLPDGHRFRLTRSSALWWVLGVAVLSASCQALGPLSDTGRRARADNRMAIEAGGPHAERWETGDLALDFEYDATPDLLTIRGRVTFSDGNRKYPSIQRARVDIHFLDGEGTILSSRPLWSPGHWVPMYLVIWNFDRRLPRPPAAEAVGFSYDATVGENGPGYGKDGGGGVDWDFWRGP